MSIDELSLNVIELNAALGFNKIEDDIDNFDIDSITEADLIIDEFDDVEMQQNENTVETAENEEETVMKEEQISMDVAKVEEVVKEAIEQPKPRKVAVVTGDDSVNYSSKGEAFRRVYEELENAVKNCGVTTILTGMAHGYELLGGAAAVCLAKKYPVEVYAVKAFTDQDAKYKQADRTVFDYVWQNATAHITRISKTYADIKKENPAFNPYHAKNEYLVDKTDVVLTFSAKHSAGAYALCQYAVIKNIPVRNLERDIPEKLPSKEDALKGYIPVKERVKKIIAPKAAASVEPPKQEYVKVTLPEDNNFQTGNRTTRVAPNDWTGKNPVIW